MNSNELEKKIAHLQTTHEHLVAELTFVDTLLKTVGFEQGLTTLKGAAEELLEGREGLS